MIVAQSVFQVTARLFARAVLPGRVPAPWITPTTFDEWLAAGAR
jgi:hypothetical protein